MRPKKALLACDAVDFCALSQFPLLENTLPRYLKELYYTSVFNFQNVSPQCFSCVGKLQEFVCFNQISSRSRFSKSSIRGFCSAGNGAGSIPLTQPLPGIPTPVYAVVSSDDDTHETHITTLDNGMRVASLNKFGQFCTVGVVIDSGSRYEIDYIKGISHFLEKTAFGVTDKFESRDHILQELERFGGICDCQSSRDTLIYGVSADTKGLPEVIHLLSDAVFKPKLTQSEMEDAMMSINFELENMDMMPIPAPTLTELIHAAAFRGNTLGLPKYCPERNISRIDQKTLYHYLNNHHKPERMVLAGVGMEHNKLVEHAQKYFGNIQPSWQQPEIIAMGNRLDGSVSQYTGGISTLNKDMSNIAPGTPIPELAHFVLGLESCSHKDDDFLPFAVLNTLMGGGDSFSAGGPGKGMYTRLYLNVLNRCHYMYSAVAANHAYEDGGLFCIQASAHPSKLKDVVEALVKEFVNLTAPISDVELSRAKRQLQSMLMMNLESRAIVFEDIGRQVLSNNERKQPEEYIDLIGKVTVEDIQRVAFRMLHSKPSVAAVGDLKMLPNYEDIQAALVSKDGKLPWKFPLFGR
ncbi:LOW QUALITY PROTEIN: mitochondrial-processing peptidase subunit alpha-like [Amphiura filiformis]|uniref:LOW QUALITY PROTEIN: mitochondrial-processing peptidase subunit alpha-like n=1 Tax=Amphiura filiformis TaxID=82378 RepID=UPI003B20FFEF